MIKCRACFMKDENLVVFDEDSVSLFNMLTNLKVSLNDGFPQYLCKLCCETINNYGEFRNKCIAVDSILRNSVKEFKFENDYEEDLNNAEQECYNSNTVLSNEEDVKAESEDYDNFIYEEEYVEEDVKIPIEINKQDEGADQRARKIIKPKKKNMTKVNSKTRKQSKHATEIPCGLCHIYFENETLFKDHISKHQKSKKCAICAAKLIDYWQTMAHRLEHIEESRHRCCYICKKKFRKTDILEYHFKTVHSNEKNILFQCNQCERKFSTPLKLRKHRWESHSTRVFICDHCKKVLHSKAKLKIHLAHHNINKRYECDQCDYKCNYRNNLKQHIFHKHTSRTCKTLCQNCKMWLDKKVHSKHKCKPRKTRICPVCGIELVSNQLNRHMATHSSGAYKCDICPSVFKTKTALEVHSDRHNGIRRYKCEYCPMAFYSRPVIIKHRRIHTGIKPYVCKICSKAFTGNHNLKMHMRVHGEDLIVKRTNMDQIDTQ